MTEETQSYPPVPADDLTRTLVVAQSDSAKSVHIGLVGDTYTLTVSGEDTGGRFSMMEQLAAKDSGPGPHKHTWSDETFYMFDGEIRFLIGEDIKTARTGDFLMIPRNTRHAFRVMSDTARYLNGYTPASLEAALVEFATPATARVLPAKNASGVIELTPALLSRYGMDMLPGPDPLRPDAAGAAV